MKSSKTAPTGAPILTLVHSIILFCFVLFLFFFFCNEMGDDYVGFDNLQTEQRKSP